MIVSLLQMMGFPMGKSAPVAVGQPEEKHPNITKERTDLHHKGSIASAVPRVAVGPAVVAKRAHGLELFVRSDAVMSATDRPVAASKQKPAPGKVKSALAKKPGASAAKKSVSVGKSKLDAKAEAADKSHSKLVAPKTGVAAKAAAKPSTHEAVMPKTLASRKVKASGAASAHPVSKSTGKSAANSATKTAAKPAAKPLAKALANKVGNKVAKAVTKPNAKSDRKAAANVKPKIVAKASDKATKALPVNKALVKSPAKTPAKTPVKTSAKTSSKTSSKTSVKTPVKTPAEAIGKSHDKVAQARPTALKSVNTTRIQPKSTTAAAKASQPAPAAQALKKVSIKTSPSPVPATPAAKKAETAKPAAATAPTLMSAGVPIKAGRPSSRLAQLTVPSMAQSVASTAAKSSFGPTLSTPVFVPNAPTVVRKDPKLANNWKTKPVEQLSDAEVIAMPDGEYMNDKQMAFFRLKLALLKQDILNSAGETTEHLREDTVIVPDPADRATIEEEHALELRTRDRERKLLKKIEQSIMRIDAGDYGYCDETGEAIGVGRLLARPTATLSLEAQQRRELKQKMFGD